MADAAELSNTSELTIQRALVELSTSSSLRPNQIGPEDLPLTFEFPSEALAYGHAQAESGVAIFVELGQPTETRFTYRIDPSTAEFVLADPASAPQKTEKRVTRTSDGREQVHYSPDSGTRMDAVREAGRMLVNLARGFRAKGFNTRLAHVIAIEAHTHPPLHPAAFPKTKDVNTQRLLRPLQITIPSTTDIAAITAKRESVPHIMFAPCGLTILMVPTDKTPKLDDDQRNLLISRMDHINAERGELQRDYLNALAGGAISSKLEATLREMYAHDKVSSSLSANGLLARCAAYMMSGDAHATLFNPLTFWDMQQLKRELDGLHAVGYYNLFTTGNTFTKFTDATPNSAIS